MSLTTPTGVQSMAVLTRRRWLVVALNVSTYAILMMVAAHVAAAGGWTLVDIAMVAAFATALPWTVLGFWNSVIGLWLLHIAPRPMDLVAPYAIAGTEATALGIKTAILMTLRNEPPARVFRRLRILKTSLDATGTGEHFSYFLLSDTNDPNVAAAEERETDAWKREVGAAEAGRITYRRRTINTGFKAGNLRDFCDRWGADYELMLPLDADSLMSGDVIVRLTHMMQTHSKLGILQSLVVGMPSSSAFARMFQFGMRHGMRTYTMGQAWWTADCGPYWGHNAMVRIAPFKAACNLPILPGEPPLGGHVLSHDQVEATLMRRAGFEVRVLPDEVGSWEENPPTILDFAKRDVRWCQGNIQYLRLLDIPGLLPVSRFQLVWAILMFLGVPAWTLMIALAPFAAWQAQGNAAFPTNVAASLYVTFLVMYLSPKIAGLIDVMLRSNETHRYGGRAWFLLSAALEFVSSFLQSAISTFGTTIFMIGLMFGRSVVWGGQSRDAYGLSWATAAKTLWPQTLFGVAVCGALYVIEPAVLWWSLPVTLGYVIAVPFAVVTASPALGCAFKKWGIAGIPEDFAPPPELKAALNSGHAT